MASTLSLSIKHHPVATALYTFYIVVWLFMCYLTYYYLVQGDVDIIQGILFYWFMCTCIPYFVVNIIMSYHAKKGRRFYAAMARLVFIPMGILILVWMEHGVIGYFHKGI